MRSSSNMPTSIEGWDRPAMETAKSAHTPVLIVGAGPVGLALAGELGWRGVPCTLIEKTDGAIEQPKMDLVGVRTMELSREAFPGRGFEACPPESPQKRERVPQDMFDPILARFARSFPHVTLRHNCELVGFEQQADG